MLNSSIVPENATGIGDIFKQLNYKADLLGQFVGLYYGYMQECHDYGLEQSINMVEIHTLSAIADNPGINISDLALLRHRTKGAISQTIKKLEAKGYVTKKTSEHNSKVVMLFPSEEGKALDLAHKQFDAMEVSKTFDDLMRQGCTAEQLDVFFFVISKYISLFLEE